MKTDRIGTALNPMEKTPIGVRTQCSSQTARWALDIRKNSQPPPAVKFVLDISFHRTLSHSGEGVIFRRLRLGLGVLAHVLGLGHLAQIFDTVTARKMVQFTELAAADLLLLVC